MKKYTTKEAGKIVQIFEAEIESRYTNEEYMNSYKCGAFRELFKQMIYQHPGLIERIRRAAAKVPTSDMTGSCSNKDK